MGERTPQHDLVNADKHSREAGMHGSVLLGSVALADWTGCRTKQLSIRRYKRYQGGQRGIIFGIRRKAGENVAGQAKFERAEYHSIVRVMCPDL